MEKNIKLNDQILVEINQHNKRVNELVEKRMNLKWYQLIEKTKTKLRLKQLERYSQPMINIFGNN